MATGKRAHAHTDRVWPPTNGSSLLCRSLRSSVARVTNGNQGSPAAEALPSRLRSSVDRGPGHGRHGQATARAATTRIAGAVPRGLRASRIKLEAAWRRLAAPPRTKSSRTAVFCINIYFKTNTHIDHAVKNNFKKLKKKL